jgi:hypothetical protein
MTRLATTPAILGILIGGMLAAGLAAGCGSNQVAIGSQNIDAQVAGLDATAGRDAPAGGNGGSATGGATGGVLGAGGVAPAGGTVGAGGAAGTGGVAPAGGTVGTGGISPTGGTIGSGGTVAAGGATPTGGTTRTGGNTPTGGNTDSGGIARTGGAAASGGATRTGGVAGTGGAGGGSVETCGGVFKQICSNDHFCDLEPGSCNVADATGTCVVNTGVMCQMVVVPVCGCNGKTYNNDCERQAAGVSKQSDGACPTADAGAGGSTGTGGVTGTGGITGSGGVTGSGGASQTDVGKTCGGISGVSCAMGTVCDLPVGSCNVADATGTCVLASQCSSLPACGCDGKTYPTDCYRQDSGMPKKSDGACFTPTLPAACLTDADCCVAMDQCMAKAYLVGRIEYEAMAASLLNVDSMEWCPPCAQPMVQVQCKGGFCAGEKIPVVSGYYPSMLMSSHCGYISVSDAGAPTSSAHAAVDAGTGADAGPSIWSCSSH